MATLVGFQAIQENSSKSVVQTDETPLATPGPFKATQIWNNIVDHLRTAVDIRTRKYLMRSYEDCFTGSDAVDVICDYLERESSDVKDVTREKVSKLCQYFLDHNIVEDAQSCGNTANNKRVIFMDSNSNFYRFSTKEAPDTPSPDPSHDLSHDVDTGLHSQPGCSNSSASPSESTKSWKRRPSIDLLQQPFDRKRKKRSSFGIGRTAHRASMAEGRTSNMKGIENAAFKDPIKMKGIQNPAFEDPYSSDRLTAIISPMRRPLATHNSHPDMNTPGFHRIGRESRRERRVSKEVISEIWKEAIIQRILHLVDLPHLDNLLACTANYHYESAEHVEKTMPVINRGTPRGRMSSRRTGNRPDINNIDPWLRSAIHCLQVHPEGATLLKTDVSLNRPLTTPGSLQARKLLLYQAVVRLYTQQQHQVGSKDPLIPALLMDIISTILGALGGGKTSRAVELTQLCLLLLPGATRLQLRALLRFMAEASKKTAMKLVYQVDNRTSLCNTFHNAVVSSPLLSAVQAKNLVSFFLDTNNKIFKVPDSVLQVVMERIAMAKQGEKDYNRVMYCQRITTEEFDVCDHAYTDEAVTKLMNSVVDDTKISLKEKKQKLKLLQKCHPEIFNRHFAGLL